MTSNALIFHSGKTLENWDWDTPLTVGIGGSETSHIELAKRIGKLNRFPVLSFCPTGKEPYYLDPSGVDWYDAENKTEVGFEIEGPGPGATWLVYRDPYFFDQDLPKHNIYWFMAQDVGYRLTAEQAAKIDRYICLCPEHAKYTEQHYPFLKGKIVLSSNGVRTDLIEQVERDFSVSRNPKKLVYASCPERGLELILENWFRIREAVPDAELVVAYGFNNIEKVAERGRPELTPFRQRLEGLLKQPGVTWTGRINQIELYKHWLSAGAWLYPTDFPETSCITCMDAQACGAIPVCNDLWALKQNVLHGLKYPGVPQKDSFLRSCMIRDLIDLLQDPARQEFIRQPMIKDAREEFNWNRFAEQLAGWHKKDHERKRNEQT